MKFFAGVKEFFRKRIVALKRKPQIIALLVLLVAFVYYSFNLTHVSDNTAYIQGKGMGLSSFVIMLFSVLAMVCFLNAFPHRKKANVPMLVLLFVMLGIVFGCNLYYDGAIDNAFVDWKAQYTTQYSKLGQDAIVNAQKGQTMAADSAEDALKLQEDMQAAAEEVQRLKTEIAALAETAQESDKAAEIEAAAKAADKAVKNAEKAAGTVTKKVEAAQTAAASASADLEKINSALANEGILPAEASDAENVRMMLDDLTKMANTVSTAGSNANKAAEDARKQLTNVQAEISKLQKALAEINGTELEEEAPVEEAPAAAAAVEATGVELPAYLNQEVAERTEASFEKRVLEHPFIEQTQHVLYIHRIILGAALALLVLLPVYAPLIRKINTSVEVEANTEMGELDLDDAE